MEKEKCIVISVMTYLICSLQNYGHREAEENGININNNTLHLLMIV